MPNKLTPFAKQLRVNATDAERLLWRKLRDSQAGVKFRRQQPIGEYIVDFICFEYKLVIELDGGHHADCVEKDEKRTKWLESQGFTVLRFWNNEVMQNMDGVWVRIADALSPSPQPSPLKGEGEYRSME